MPAPDWVRPLAGLDDVPIERDRISAMGAGSRQITRHSLFKPYVYRGWGIDLFEDLPSVRTEPAPKRKRKRKRKPRSRYHWTPPEHKPEPEPKIEHKPEHKPEPEPKTEHKPIRPSPGWQPMTGADLDALFDEVFGE